MIRCSNCGWNNNVDGSSNCEKCNAPLSGEQSVQQLDNRNENFIPTKTVREPLPDMNPQMNPSSTGTTGIDPICTSCGYPLRNDASECPQCHTSLRNKSNTARGESGANINSNSVICQKCGSKNSINNSFCSSCGNPIRKKVNESIEIKCKKCGYDNTPNASFCAKCGSSLKKHDINKTILPSQISRCTLRLVPEENETIEPIILNFNEIENILNRENTEPDNKTITREEQALLTFENKKWYIQNKSAMNSTLIVVKDKMELNPGDVIMLGDRKFEFDY